MLELKNIKKYIKNPSKIERVLFDDLCFSLSDTIASVAVMGRSGSGKTTLLNIIAGLDINYEGDYYFNSDIIDKKSDTMAKLRLENMSMITQSYDLLGDRNVLDNVLVGFKHKYQRSKIKAEHYLNLVGLAGYGTKKIRHLSGGECQRVAIARALVKEPALLLADEPTGALDEISEQQVLAIFKRLKASGTKIIIVTHNKAVAESCEQIVIIKDKKIVTTVGL